jgi:hypothetical protein
MLASAAVLVIAACNTRLLVEEGEDEPWTGNDPSCPATLPPGGPGTCDVAEGLVCAFEFSDTSNPGYVTRQLCGCFEASSTERRWLCYMGESSPWDCPDEEPSSGDPCFGHFGKSCSYPERSYCTCAEDPGTWSCQEEGRDDLTPPPSTIPAGKAVNALTSEERAEWCDWYVTLFNGPGYPEPPPSAVDENGYTMNNGCYGAQGHPCNAKVPTISSGDCEANLGLTSCEAPISELSDCVTTVIDVCWPSPHGCARYFERTGCNGTIATEWDGSAGSNGGTGGTGGSSGVTRDVCSVRVR